jgi:hypothetical protein
MNRVRRSLLMLCLPIFLSGCATDKLLHFGVGTAVGVVGDDITGGYGCELAIAAGLLKELIDPVFSTLDLLATATYCLKDFLPLLKPV